MSPISDIGAFRTGRWRLEWFLESVRLGVKWAIEHRAVYDFLGQPSCLYVTDPGFCAIGLICDLVCKAGDRAAIVGLDALERGRVRGEGGDGAGPRQREEEELKALEEPNRPHPVSGHG